MSISHSYFFNGNWPIMIDGGLIRTSLVPCDAEHFLFQFSESFMNQPLFSDPFHFPKSVVDSCFQADRALTQNFGLNLSEGGGVG